MKKINSKKSYIYIFGILLIIFVIFFTIKLKLKNTIQIELVGEQVLKLNINEQYQEKGINIKKCSLIKCKKIDNENTLVENNVDNSKIGNYKINYTYKYKNHTYKLTRIVKVIDNEKPTIELLGNLETTLCPNEAYQEEGFIATDNYDGNITDKVLKTEYDNKILYEVSDSSGNITKTERILKRIDQEKPTIKLNGSTTIYIKKGNNYNELGYTVDDNCNKNLKEKTTVTGKVNTSIAGTYYLNYEVIDNFGNKATEKREIIVYDLDENDLNNYVENLNYYFKEKNYNVSIGYINLNNNYSYFYNKDQIYFGASLIKTLDAIYVYENMELNETNKELVKEAISISSNDAHYQLLKIIGFDNLKKYGLSLGAKHTLDSNNNNGNTTVSDQIIYLKKLYQVINTNINGNELKNYFINDYGNYIKLNNDIPVIHKYGYYYEYYHDVGIVLDDNPYIIVILTKEGNNNYQHIINDISNKIYKLHLQTKNIT